MGADLWRDLAAWAEQELRSVNGQIEYLLRGAVKQRKKNVGKAEGNKHEKPEDRAA